MSDIKLFKLSNGEEIVARKKDTAQSNSIVLEQPMGIQAVPSEQKGRIGIALIPWLVGATEGTSITLSTEHIVVETDPKESIEKNYLSKITGLTL